MQAATKTAPPSLLEGKPEGINPIEFGQPLIEVTGEPTTDYFIGEVRFDVWANLTSDGWVIEAIALHNTRVDMTEVFARSVKKDIEAFCDDTLGSWEQYKQDCADMDADLRHKERETV